MSINPRVILFADDDLDDQDLLKEAFLDIDGNLVIHTRSSGREALAFLENCPDHELPRLIILDYNIPDMNGAEIFETINLNPRYGHITKVVWSTSNSPLYRQICKDAGIDHYFEKPQRYQEILELGKKMLGLMG